MIQTVKAKLRARRTEIKSLGVTVPDSAVFVPANTAGCQQDHVPASGALGCSSQAALAAARQ